jgi:hypothetical protein
MCAKVNGLEYEEACVEKKFRLTRSNMYHRRYCEGHGHVHD